MSLLKVKELTLTFLCTSLLLLPNPALANPQMAATWNGHIQLPNQQLKITINLKQDSNQWTGSIDIPAQQAKNLALVDFKVDNNQITFKIKGVPGKPTFKGSFSPENNELKGQFIQGGQTFSFSLNKPSEAKNKEEETKLDQQIEQIKKFIEEQRKEWQVPGVAIGIVKGDKTLLSQGFGERNQQQHLPVTDQTLFSIGSTTKAFTSVLMASLVDEGKISWDTPIKQYLPDFKLKDAYASENISTKDLLTHRSGLPRHDLMWYGSPFSRQELFSRLKFLTPSTSFRDKFQYQNLMFMTAGYLAESVTKQPWETLIQERIFKPLNMTQSNFNVAQMRRSPDYAYPYKSLNGQVQEIPFRDIQAIGPAGSINSNVSDMLKWLKMNLNGNDAIISRNSLKNLHSPHIVMSSQTPFAEIPHILYGMGWMVFPYRGQTIVEHGGNIDGFSAHVSMLPQADLGLVILTNKDATPLPTILTYGIYERLTDMPLVDWSARLKQGKKQQAQIAQQQNVGKKEWTKASHPLNEYAGKYSSPAYGTIEIEESFGQLKLRYNGFYVPLKHWHYDVFSLDDKRIPLHGMKLQFISNLQGEIEHISSALEPAASPVLFSRQPDPRLFEISFLNKIVGKYELFGLTITVERKGNKLYVAIPGQPIDELVPHRDLSFRSKNEPQISIQFVLEGDKATKAVINQPNGTFEAKRK